MISRLLVIAVPLAGLVSFSAATGSFASDGLSPDREWGNAQGWNIYWNEVRQGCFSAVQFQDETIFWIGLNTGGREGFVAAANGRWGFVSPGKQYKVELFSDAVSLWKGDMIGGAFDGIPVLEANNIKAELLSKL